MKKNKFYQLICLLLVVFVIGSCHKENNRKLKVNFSNPQALLVKKSKTKSTTEIETPTLFQIDENGKITPVVEGVEVYRVYPFSEGAIIYTNNGIYIIYFDNTYWKLPDDFYADFVGENEEGDLIFKDVSIIRKGSQTISKLQTALTEPYILCFSGNFVIIQCSELSYIRQIFNTVDNKRYPGGGLDITALSKEKALCGNQIIDMTTGIWHDSECSEVYRGIYLKNGAIIMGKIKISEYETICTLGFMDTSGHVELLCNDEIYSNSQLFNTGDYFIFNEYDQISVVKRGNLSKTEILTDYYILKIAVNSNKVYFISEEGNYGVKQVGFFSLDDNTVTILETEDEYEDIFSI